MTIAHPDTPRGRDDTTAPHMSGISPAEDARSVLINRVAWGAVLAGVVLSLVAQLIFNMIGIGVGAATVGPGTGETPSAETLSIGAAVWWTVSGILAALIGGYAAGRLSGRPRPSTAAWHGLTSWAVTTLVLAYLVTTAVGGLLGGATRLMSQAVGGVGQAAGSAAQAVAPQLARAADPFSSIEQTLRGALGGNDPAALRDTAVAAVRALVTGDPAQMQEARDRAAQALARAQNVAVEQAREQVERYEQQYRQRVEQARREATEAADTAAKAVSRGALLAALSLVLGALAAWFGGRWGTIAPTMTEPGLRTDRWTGGVEVEDERASREPGAGRVVR